MLELGYRGQPDTRFSYSLTAYHHRHESLRTQSLSPAGPVLENNGEGETTGIEGWGTWRPADRWRLSGGFVRQRQSLRTRPGTVDLLAPGSLGNDPRGWLVLRAGFDLTPAHDFDLMLRRVGALPDPHLSGYTAVDARLAWRARRNVELALAVQNLFDPVIRVAHPREPRGARAGRSSPSCGWVSGDESLAGATAAPGCCVAAAQPRSTRSRRLPLPVPVLHQWPRDALPGDSSHRYRRGRREDVAAELQQIAAGRSVDGRRVVVRACAKASHRRVHLSSSAAARRRACASCSARPPTEPLLIVCEWDGALERARW